MGIQGLLPFLKQHHISVHISEFSQQTIGIDAYVWLHKAAFGCALDLLVDETSTRKYIDYCMKRIRELQKYEITPFLVFDGAELPMKKRTERHDFRRKALECWYKKDMTRAMEFAQKCVDITPYMARQLILSLREESVPYVVAPYEADAQLAYLQKRGIISTIITEDSDLLAFGCNQVIFKLEPSGKGVMINSRDIGTDKQGWNHEKTRHMCILSGCDYLPSLPGVGLVKAEKCMKMYRDGYLTIRKWKDLGKIISAPKVPREYEKQFRLADLTFVHQRVFDPVEKKLTHVMPLKDVDVDDLSFLGPEIDEDIAFGIATGDINPSTKERFSGPLADESIFNKHDSAVDLTDVVEIPSPKKTNCVKTPIKETLKLKRTPTSQKTKKEKTPIIKRTKAIRDISNIMSEYKLESQYSKLSASFSSQSTLDHKKGCNKEKTLTKESIENKGDDMVTSSFSDIETSLTLDTNKVASGSIAPLEDKDEVTSPECTTKSKSTIMLTKRHSTGSIKRLGTGRQKSFLLVSSSETKSSQNSDGKIVETTKSKKSSKVLNIKSTKMSSMPERMVTTTGASPFFFTLNQKRHDIENTGMKREREDTEYSTKQPFKRLFDSIPTKP